MPTSNLPLRRLLAALLIVGVGSLGVASAASGQEDPYGSTSTTSTTAPSSDPVCGTSLESAQVGASVTATVSNVPPGTTVRILFNGSEVASGTADVQAQSVGGPVLFGGVSLPAQANGSVSLKFAVPDVPPGTYTIAAVGDTFTVICGSGGFTVLGASQGGGGSLARTGVFAGLLLAIALVLLLVGRALMEESKRRKRRARRAGGSADGRYKVGV